MAETNTDVQNLIAEVRFRRELLESLLVVASRDGQDRLPTVEECILREVVNGTIAYTHGGECAERFEHESFWYGSSLRTIWNYFKAQLDGVNTQKLEPRIDVAVRKLVEPHLERAPPERSHLETELGYHFKGFAGGGICPVIMKSTFYLPAEVVWRVQRDVLPSLSDAQKRDVLGIGASMQKYVAEDIGVIYNKYQW